MTASPIQFGQKTAIRIQLSPDSRQREMSSPPSCIRCDYPGTKETHCRSGFQPDFESCQAGSLTYFLAGVISYARCTSASSAQGEDRDALRVWIQAAPSRLVKKRSILSGTD